MTIASPDGSWPTPIGGTGTISDFVFNRSNVPGATVTDALNDLNGRSASVGTAWLRHIDSEITIPTAASPSVFVRCTASAPQFVLSGADFTLGANGELTFTGSAPRTALVQLNATLEVVMANQGSSTMIAIDLNGDCVGVDVFSAAAFAGGQVYMELTQVGSPRANYDVTLSTCRLLAISPGDIISPVFAVEYHLGTFEDILLEGLTMSVVLI